MAMIIICTTLTSKGFLKKSMNKNKFPPGAFFFKIVGEPNTTFYHSLSRKLGKGDCALYSRKKR